MLKETLRFYWGLQKNIRIVVTTTIVSILGYTVWIIVWGAQSPSEPAFSSLGLIVIQLFFCLYGLQIYLRGDYDRRLRQGWLMLVLGTLSSLVAECIWFYRESILHVEPFLSLADLFYLLYYPLTLAGLLRFPFIPAERRERLTLLMDLSIVMTTCVIIFWYYILAPLQMTLQADLAGVVAVAYPIGDLLLLTGVAAVIQSDVEKLAFGSMVFLAGGMIFTVIADALFAYYEVNAIAYEVAYLNFFWILAAGFNLFAVVVQLRIRSGPPASVTDLKFTRSKRLLQLALPYIAVAVGLVMQFMCVNATENLDPRVRGVMYGVLLLIGLVLLRQYIVLRENVHLYQEMRRMASTDSLTGLYNRHFFNEIFLLELERAQRFNRSLSILLIDVDGFKKINDRYGHLQGDTVLKTVAQMLAAHIRSADLIARFGGDEFIVILTDTNLVRARLVARRLKTAVSSRLMTLMPLGISVGVAAYRTGITPEQFLEDADHDLYRQKGNLGYAPNLEAALHSSASGEASQLADVSGSSVRESES